MQDWTGNKNSVYKTLGASNHTDKEMQRFAYIHSATKISLETQNFKLYENFN